jgi:hypothetical protein
MDHQKEFINVNGQNIDISDINSELEKTNRTIYELSQGGSTFQTTMGLAVVIPLNLLKVMKLSSLPLGEIKNSSDLKWLNHIDLSKTDLDLVEIRTKETLLKISKDSFFNKYDVFRFFDHDELHVYVNMTPIYKTILNEQDLTSISQEKFKRLPLDQKVLVFWEEAMVLSLERWLIPQVRKYPMRIDEYCEQFFLVEKNSDPSVYWVNCLCAIGQIKDHPEWLAQWGIDNYESILVNFSQWWEDHFDNIDESFWTKLLKF